MTYLRISIEYNGRRVERSVPISDATLLDGLQGDNGARYIIIEAARTETIKGLHDLGNALGREQGLRAVDNEADE